MQNFVLTLKRPQHVSVFIAVASLGFIIGISLAVLPNSFYFVGPGWFVFAILLLALSFWIRSTWMLSLILCAGILFGLARAMPLQKEIIFYKSLMGHTVVVKGKVVDDVVMGKHGDKQLKLTDVKINDKQSSGTIWVSTSTNMNIKRSFEVSVQGKVSKGFGNYSASMFKAKVLKVTDNHDDKAREVRDWFSNNVRQVISEPQASLGIGFLVGQRSSLPESLEQALKIVGLTHIVVASGYNLTILVRFARRIFAPISKYLATLAGSLMIGGFILVTGFSPSMTRAGLVTGISLATWYYGRHIHPLVLLPFVAALTALINPSYLWGDLGWYLSFAAFAGVMILAPLLQNYFFGPKKPGTLRQIIGETISAQLVTIPIIAFSFGTIAVFALPANLLILPFVPLAMASVFVSGLSVVIIPVAAPLLGSITQTLLNYMTSVINWFVKFPNASVEVSFNVMMLIISYVVIVCVALILQRTTRHNFRNDNLVE